MIDELIESTLKTLKVPVSRVFSTSKASTYINWSYITSLPDNYSDDDSQTLIHTLRVHIFSKNNYISLLDNVIQALKAAGFTITSIDSEIFEQETGLFHRPITIRYMEEQ